VYRNCYSVFTRSAENCG